LSFFPAEFSMHIDRAGQACFAGLAAAAFLALALLLFGGRRVFAMRPSTPAADSRIFLLSSGHYSVKTWPADPRLALGRCANITSTSQMKLLHVLVILPRSFSAIQHPTHACA
jgi:hypothetical protein